MFRAKGGGGTHPDLLWKGEREAEVGGKEGFQAQCIRDY
jgi:hypothetical protein